MNNTTKLLTPIVVPVGFHDFVVLPWLLSPTLPAGLHNIRLSATVEVEDTSTPQFWLKPAFNIPGAATLSESRLVSHSRFGLSHEGSDVTQTAVPPIEVGSINGISVLKGHWEWVGEILVLTSGYTALLFGGEVEAGKPVTITEATIEIY